MFPLIPGNVTAVSNTPLLMQRSLRFRSSASARLNKTLTTPTNNKVFTWSGWVKRGTLGTLQLLFAAYDGTSAFAGSLYFNTDNTLVGRYGGTSDNLIATTAVFRDTASWYHVVYSVNATTTSSALYVNGVLAASSSSVPANVASQFNSPLAHYIGSTWVPGSFYDGYMAEVNFIDGQALTPSSFGVIDSTTGVWQPKKYSGSYGINGFYLPFTDNSALTTSSNVGLGKDFSPNGNFFATNNISLATTLQGTTYDSFTDVPTLTDATASNFCTWDRSRTGSTGVVLADGNLRMSIATSPADGGTALGTIGVSSGKWYWEVRADSLACLVGISADPGTVLGASYPGASNLPNSWGYYGNGGQKYNGGSAAAYGGSYNTGDVVGVALDLVAQTLTFYLNGASQGAINISALAGLTLFPAIGNYTLDVAMGTANFGQRPFAYTPPTGHLALNTFNLPTPSIVKPNTQFDATLYVGNGSTQNVVNAGAFQPDLVWIKDRTSISDHKLIDSSRGVQKAMSSNLTAAEVTDTTGLTAFNSNGFSVGANAAYNTNTDNMVAWQWKKGATPGFDIVTYTGNATARTISHSLGVAPKMMIIRPITVATDWAVYHASMGATPATQVALLNQNAASFFNASTVWNGTMPTSTVFSLGIANGVNQNGVNFLAYLWSEIPGFSKFGTYTGNGSTDGVFVYCGFKPRFLLIKTSSWTANWVLIDTARSSINQLGIAALGNLTSAEITTESVDILSNGFKTRQNSAGINGNGNVHIFAAFAENPFKYALAR